MISLLNATDPDVAFFLNNMVSLEYQNSISPEQGEKAFQKLLDTLNTEFILIVDGAISIKDNGLYNVVANYKGKIITGMEAVKMTAEKAKYIIAVGTCASYGGISAASPNEAECRSLKQFLQESGIGKQVIILPGCPGNPDWIIGTIANLIEFGVPELDDEGRPIVFYGTTIHDNCERRSYFDKGIFAEKLDDKECMFKLGCKGPITKVDCPIRRWNDTDNWPVGNNTPCIGCAQKGFAKGIEPFIRLSDIKKN
nr:hydrogenase small subunit [Clostridium grantii]